MLLTRCQYSTVLTGGGVMCVMGGDVSEDEWDKHASSTHLYPCPSSRIRGNQIMTYAIQFTYIVLFHTYSLILPFYYTQLYRYISNLYIYIYIYTSYRYIYIHDLHHCTLLILSMHIDIFLLMFVSRLWMVPARKANIIIIFFIDYALITKCHLHSSNYLFYLNHVYQFISCPDVTFLWHKYESFFGIYIVIINSLELPD